MVKEKQELMCTYNLLPDNQKLDHNGPIYGSVKLSYVLTKGKRLEASVFNAVAENADAIIESCPFPKKRLISTDSETGFVSNCHYGNRLKRNYVEESPEALGFLGSAEMLDVLPSPQKFLSCKDPNTNALAVKPHTILFSRSGTIGNLTYVNKTLSKHLVSEHAIRLECYDYPGYVYSFLRTSEAQSIIASKIYGAVIQQIEPEHLSDIPVPDPPAIIKEKIHNLIVESFRLRDESNALLEAAERILLEEISSMQVKKSSSLSDSHNSKELFYSVKLSKINGRIDANFHNPYFSNIVAGFNDSTLDVFPLSEKKISKEVTLPGRFKRVYVAEGQGSVFLGGKQIGQIDPFNKKYLSNGVHGGRINKELSLSENMILITRSGTIGKVAFVPRHWESWIVNEHIIRVVPATTEIAGYLYIYLASKIGRELIMKNIFGSVVDEIDVDAISNLPVPIIRDIEKRSKINSLALEANQKRYEAYQFEQEAINTVEKDVFRK